MSDNMQKGKVNGDQGGLEIMLGGCRFWVQG